MRSEAMNRLFPVNGERYKYERLIGTGGVGSGIVFNLDGDHTLGRNESRSGKLMPFRDYCKLHIIMHYPAVLLGKGRSGFTTYPISNVGCDDVGKALLYEMTDAGMNTSGVSKVPDRPTLYSVCFQYPDKSGGNITTSNSACDTLSPEDIDRFIAGLPEGQSEIYLAAPEVPLESRLRLLEHGRKRGGFNVGAVLSFEVSEFLAADGIMLLDLLAVNIDEALAIAGIQDENTSSVEVAEACWRVVAEKNKDIMLAVTCGANGSYCFYHGEAEHVPILPMNVVSTAGAGDAFLGGTIAGLCCGLPFIKGGSCDTFAEAPLADAVELGTLVSNLTVTSPDTIFHELDMDMLKRFCAERSFKLSDEYKKMFGLIAYI
jgi:sugar/nucleoside kinase (ribokinase family)